MNKMNEDLIVFLNSKDPVPYTQLEQMVFMNSCLRAISQGAYGKTYSLGILKNCQEVILVKVAKFEDVGSDSRLSLIAELSKEGQLQEKIYKIMVQADLEGRTVNAKRLIPVPIKQQDEFLFMQFIPDSYTLFQSLPRLSTENPLYFKSILFQIASFFALIEETMPDFRHTDLHFNNILITRPQVIQMQLFNTSLKDIFATIIDFGLAENNSDLCVDIMRILGLVCFDPSLLVKHDQSIQFLSSYSESIWERVLKVLLAPYMVADQYINFYSVFGYLAGSFEPSREYEQSLMHKMSLAGFIKNDFDGFTFTMDRTKIRIQSREVAELLKTI